MLEGRAHGQHQVVLISNYPPFTSGFSPLNLETQILNLSPRPPQTPTPPRP